VYAPSAERAQEIAQVVRPFKLRILRYYGTLAVIDFPSA
jgi:hypothetical protein